MFTLNGVRNGAGKGAPVLNGGKYARINGNPPYEYDKWRMMWNGNHFAPPEPGSVLYFPGYPGAGATIHDFSEVGNASAVLRQSDDSAVNGSQSSYTASGKTLTVTKKLSSVRIKFDLLSSDDVELAYGKIYKNGIAVGTERSVLDDAGWTTYSEDFTTLVPGDVITVWAHCVAGAGNWNVRRLRIYYSYNDGAITGATWVWNGKIWVLNFDGTDDYVTIAASSSLVITPSITIIAWVKPTANALYGIYSGKWPTATRFNLNLAATGAIQLLQPGLKTRALTSTTPIVAGIPQQVAYVKRGAGATNEIYHNGVSQALTTNDSWTFSSGLDSQFIGCQENDVAFFAGQIGLVRVFNSALTAAQILNYYNQERSLFGV